MKKGKSKLLWLKRNISLGFLLVGVLFILPQPIQAKTYELSFALHAPTRAAPYHSAFLPWSEEVEKRTKGQIKIKFYPSQTLVKARDSYDAVVNGITDIVWGAHGWTAGRFPLTSVLELPFVSSQTHAAARAANELLKKFPEIAAEHKDVHVISLWVSAPYQLHTVKKPVRTIADMKGMKLASQAGAIVALQGLGSVPIAMNSAKMYPTLEKGVTDGAGTAWGAFKAFKLAEVTKYHTNANLGGIPWYIAMNKNTWNSLPNDLQKIITEVSSEMLPVYLCDAVFEEAKEGQQIARSKGQEIIDLPPAEMAKWQATAKPALDKWVSNMEAKGLPGQAVLDEAVRLIKKYQK